MDGGRPFFVAVSLGLIWAAVWFWYYRDTPDEHRSVNAEERELIRSSLELARGSKSLRVFPGNAFCRVRRCGFFPRCISATPTTLSVYLVWFPKYLNDHRGFNLQQMGFYASLPLLAGTVGDVFGGWFSDLLGQVVRRSEDGSPHGGGWRFPAFGFVYRACVSYDELA